MTEASENRAAREGHSSRRTQRERRQTAETSLLIVATRLIVEKGYGGFSLSDLAAEAGYSRGLPAHYFGKKDQLLSRVADFIVARYNLSVAGLPPSEPGLPRLEALIRHHGGRQNRTSRAFMMLVAESLVRPDLGRTISQLNKQGFDAIRDALRDGIERGNVRADIDADVEARVVFAFIRGQMSLAAVGARSDTVATAEAFVTALRKHLSPGS